MSEATVAKSRARKRKPEDLEIRTIGLRVTRGWADWLERAAKHDRVTVATFLDKAAADRARAIGFDEAPPERLP